MLNSYIIALLKCKGVSSNKIARYVLNNDFDSYKIKNNLRNILEYEDYIKFHEYLNAANIEIDLNFRHGIRLITMLDKKFPKKLYECNDPVVFLYYKGNIDLINKKSVLIVSSKDIIQQSLEDSTKISTILSSHDISVIGGLSLGVDTYSHLGALEGQGGTIAVLPSDLDHIVPAANKKLAEDILKNNGCLISEYSIGHILNKYCYEKRDRVKSALCDALLLIEAKENSPIMELVKFTKRDNKIIYQLSTNMNKRIRNVINIERYSDINNFIIKLQEEKRIVNEQLTLF